MADSERYYHPPVSNYLALDYLLDYLNNYEKKDHTTWLYRSGKSMVYREKDVFNMDEVERSAFYIHFCVPHTIHDALLASLANGEYAGLVTLYRENGDDEFSDDDIFNMELFKDHLECRHMIEMRKEKAIKTTSTSDNSMKYIKEYNLTLREVQVLELLLDGKSTDCISSTLSISLNTVKKHIVNIYKKLGITRRSELIKLK